MVKKDILSSSLVVFKNASIEEVMGAITDNQRGAAVVVDTDGVFVGVVSDGDIRRGMLRGAIPLTPVSKVLNTNAALVTPKDVEGGKVDEIFHDRSAINILPVVSVGNILVDVLIREPKKRKEL